MPPALDEIWLRAAARLGVPVARGGDAYVHWDGDRLHLAGDEHLDADDTVAQLVLHELCHALVQGPAAMHLPDWGLDNTNDRDAVREAAAVRLQAHLAGGHALRGALFPTTVVRSFFAALPDDAFAPAGDPSSALARLAALRAAAEPWASVLDEALDATARAFALPRHEKSGFPRRPSALPARRCGECALRSSGGLCRPAPTRVFVGLDLPACARFEAALDCLACGACCRSAYDAVPVGPREPVVRRHPDLVVARGGRLELRRVGDHCAALTGPPGGPFACSIYLDRPRTCRDFEAGGRHCLTARRRVGLTLR